LSWSSFNKRTWSENRLTSVLFELTYACNLDCEFCYNDLSLRGEPLTLAEYHTVLDELADMGVLNLTFSGGEPLANKDFFAIAGRARDLGIRLKVNSTLTRYNEHEIDGMFAICDELGAQFQVDPEVKPRDDGDRTPTALTASDSAREHLSDILRERAVKRVDPEAVRPPRDTRAGANARRAQMEGSDTHCAAGAAHLTVDPVGGVLPCVQWRVTVGNVRQGLRAIFEHGEALAEVRETTRAVKRMLDAHGDAGQLMNFCPGAAHTHSGDPLALYGPAIERLAVAKRYFLPVL